MSYDELALFFTIGDRSKPFVSDEFLYQKDRFYGRRLTNVSYTDSDNSLLTWEDDGETVELLGRQFVDGLVVLCARVNHQWYAIRPALMATFSQLIATGEYKGGEQQNHYNGSDFPDVVELITTGDSKAELDGVYSLIPRHNGNGQRRDAVSHYCVGTDLKRKPGASMVLSKEPAIVEGFSSANYKYTLTVTHPDIETTVYQSLTTGGSSLNYLVKFVGDSSLPNDAWRRFSGAPGMMPLWFDLESDDESITGLYSLWPTYFTEPTSFGTVNKGYIHGAEGVRKALVYNLDYYGGDIDFRIQIGVPSGGALRYNCLLEDFSFENGSRMTFNLETNTSSSSVPDTIEVRRPQVGYCRTPKREHQL